MVKDKKKNERDQ